MSATILVIEDSADDQRLYQRALRDVDCRLVLTSTGEDGFASAVYLEPDLILLDYHLPDMDGLGFIKLLEKYPCPPLPIVVLTGEGKAEAAVEMMKRGAADYLVKDTAGVYLRLLSTVIERVMAAAAQRTETRRLQQETAALLRRNQALMKNSKDGIHVMDVAGNLLEANDAFCRMLGYAPEEATGLNVADWNAQWSVAELRAKFKSMVGKSAVFETRHRRKDGTLIDVEVSTASVQIDGQHLFFAASRDITERKRTEAALRKSEANQRAILDNSPHLIWLKDTESRFIMVNKAFANHLRTWDAHQVAGKTDFDLWPRELAEKYRADDVEVISTRQRKYVEEPALDGDRKLWVETYKTPIIDDDGNVLGTAGFAMDITERQRAAEEQRLSAQLLNSATDSVFLLDLEGNFVHLNDAAWKSRGYTREELMAMNVCELTTPESGKLVASRIKELLEKGHVVFESEHRCKDGYIMPVEVSSRVIESGGRKLILSSCRDITERKKADAALRQYKLALDTSIDGFWVCDMRGYVLEANGAYAKMSGYAVAELVGMHICQLEAIELSPEVVAAHLAKVAAQGYDRFETRHRHKDGHEIDIEVAVTYMAEPQQLVVFCRDISERKRASLALQHKQDLLNEAQRLGKLGSWELDLLSGRLHWSDEMYRIFEQDPARFTHSYEGFLDVIHPDDRDKVNRAYTRSLRDHLPYDVEHRLLFADGRVKWVREHCTNTFDEAGQPLHSRGMTHDITERREAEAALLMSEANMRAMLDNSPYLTWLKDAEGRYITINKVFADYLRLEDVSQAAGKTDLDLQPRELAEKYRADDAEVMAARQRKQVEEAAFDGESVHWVETCKTPIIDAQGNVHGTVGFARDITGRKQAEEALRRSERGLAESQRMAHLGSWELDLVTNALIWSDEIYRIFEIDQERFGASYEAFINAIHPDDRELVNHAYSESVRNKTPYDIVHRLLMSDGRVKYVSEKCETHYGEDGKPLRSAGTVHDITERRNAEVVLRQHKLVIDASIDGFCMIDTNGNLLEANAAYAKMSGYPVEALVNMHISQLEAKERAVDIRAHIAKVIEQGYDRFETRHRHRDGHEIDVEVSVTYMAEPQRLFVFCRDITERKKAEKQILLESEAERRRAEMLAQQFGHLLQNSFNEIYLFDADSLRFLQTSTGARRNLGYSADELEQLTPLDLKPSYTRESFEALLAPLRGREQQSLLFETTHRRKDGTTYPVEVRLQLMDAGSVFLAVIRDITERKRAEQQARELSAHLQTVREEEKASFAREIHDDLGSTLTALKLDASWLAQKLPAEAAMLPLRECVKSMAELLDNAVRATRRIITDLRPVILDTFGIEAALKWQADQFHKRTGIECRFACICGANRNCGDKLDWMLSINLFRIFQEALTNVARHSGASRVEVEFRLDDNEVALSISDNGCGLPEGHVIAATSFGLRSMSERVEQLAGQIGFVRPPGGGFGVTVKLPLPAAVPQQAGEGGSRLP